jgi:hypothetical protein
VRKTVGVQGTTGDRLLLRRRGGAVLRYGLMRAYATWPLAVLEIYPGRVRLGATLLSWIGGDLDASPAEVVEVNRARGLLGTRGVAFRMPDGRCFFFWTPDVDAVMKVLEGEGFAVGTQECDEANY